MAKVMLDPDIARMAREGIEHALAGTIPLRNEIMKLPAANYTDPERFELERDRIFRRLPMMLALSCEVRNPGDYKTISAIGVPVLIVRGQDGIVRAFVNSCAHRGAAVATAEQGNARRFACPYHGWTYNQTGALVGVASSEDFGEIDRSCYGLTALPAAERSGLIFVTLDPKSTVDIDDFLCGFDKMLDLFNLKDWHVLSSKTFATPNWKLVNDGTLDSYHLPILHKNTLARNGDIGNRALCYTWGPHMRNLLPDVRLKTLSEVPESEWTDTQVMAGGWLVFPNVSMNGMTNGIARRHGAGRSTMVTRTLPGENVGEATHTLLYVVEKMPEDDETMAKALAQFTDLQGVVGGEDIVTEFRQQEALRAGLQDVVLFGRNEVTNQRFHHWLETLIAADDQQLGSLFRASGRAALANKGTGSLRIVAQ